MSELLAIHDFNSSEFIDRIHGMFLHSVQLANRAEELRTDTTKRIAGIRQHAFNGLSEIGEALLRVSESLPERGFEDWFQLHEERLGFSRRHAFSCKSAARLVREFGPEKALALSQAATRESPKPLIALTVRLSRPIEELSESERQGLCLRLQPAVDLHGRLTSFASASASTDESANVCTDGS